MDRLLLRQSDERVAELVRKFLEARSFFFQHVEPYGRDGSVDFPRLHEFVETELFGLKEDCHQVFRPPHHKAPTAASSGPLFDLLIGSIFHEMMKIKENIYHLEVYAPEVDRLSERAKTEKLPEYERAFIRAYQLIERRAQRSLRTDIDGVIEIFRDAADNLKTLLREHRGSSLLARMLVENEELVNEVYGPSGLEQVLGEMFDGDLAEAYLVAGRDFLEGGWFDKARALFQKALQIDPDKQLARQLLQRVDEAVGQRKARKNKTSVT